MYDHVFDHICANVCLNAYLHYLCMINHVCLGDECIFPIFYHFECSTEMYVTWKSDP